MISTTETLSWTGIKQKQKNRFIICIIFVVCLTSYYNNVLYAQKGKAVKYFKE